MGLVCKHDLVGTSPVQCLRCGQLHGSAIVPMQSCVVQTQPYSWLRMEYREVKVKVSSRKHLRPREYFVCFLRRQCHSAGTTFGSLSL